MLKWLKPLLYHAFYILLTRDKSLANRGENHLQILNICKDPSVVYTIKYLV